MRAPSPEDVRLAAARRDVVGGAAAGEAAWEGLARQGSVGARWGAAGCGGGGGPMADIERRLREVRLQVESSPACRGWQRLMTLCNYKL